MMKGTAKLLNLKPLYLSREQAATFLSISQSTLEKMAAKRELPPPRKISGARTGWLLEELEAWGRSRPLSDLTPPANSGYGRAGKAGSSVSK